MQLQLEYSKNYGCTIFSETFLTVFTKERGFHFLAFSVILFGASLPQTRLIILHCEQADIKIAQVDV